MGARKYEFYVPVARTINISRVRYCSCHNSIKFISSSQRVISFYYTNIAMTAFLMIFRRFPTTSRRLLKIFSKIVQNGRQTFPNIFQEFPKMSKDVRRFPKIAEEFRGRPEDVSMIHQRI